MEHRTEVHKKSPHIPQPEDWRTDSPLQSARQKGLHFRRWNVMRGRDCYKSRFVSQLISSRVELPDANEMMELRLFAIVCEYVSVNGSTIGERFKSCKVTLGWPKSHSSITTDSAFGFNSHLRFQRCDNIHFGVTCHTGTGILHSIVVEGSFASRRAGKCGISIPRSCNHHIQIAHQAVSVSRLMLLDAQTGIGCCMDGGHRGWLWGLATFNFGFGYCMLCFGRGLCFWSWRCGKVF